MASPHRLARSPSSASRAAPAFSTANFVRSLRKAASFGYRKPSAGVVDAAGTMRRRSADTVVMSPCRASLRGVPGISRRGVGGAPGSRRLPRASAEGRACRGRRRRRLRRRTWRTGRAKLLYVWRRVAELRNIHTAKRIVAQRWRQKVKLGRLLRPQLPLLAAWETLGGPHSDAVADLGRVLSAASTSLPLSDGARANLELLHETMLACARTVDEIKARADMFYATGSVTSSSVDELARTMQEELAGLEEVMRLCKIVTNLQSNLKQTVKHDDLQSSVLSSLNLVRRPLQHKYLQPDLSKSSFSTTV
ncbi:hypothetical protein VPH35_001994 [Triticum aestivum]